jgi:hypothetical protein
MDDEGYEDAEEQPRAQRQPAAAAAAAQPAAAQPPAARPAEEVQAEAAARLPPEPAAAAGCRIGALLLWR